MGCPRRYHCAIRLIGVLSFAQAYIIDDTNSTVQYIPPNLWVHNSTDARVDFSKLYNSTYTYAVCRTIDGCNFRIPFTGTGIDVYQLIWAPINASIILDGGSPQIFVRDGSCLSLTPLGCYNMSMYNTQSLAYNDHLLEIALQDYAGGQSDFNLDYVVINDTRISLVNPLNGTTLSRKQVNAIVGGTIGGLAIVVAFVIALICFRRQRQHQPETKHVHSERRPDVPPSYIVDHQLPNQPSFPQFVPPTSARNDTRASAQPITTLPMSTTFSNPTPRAPALTTFTQDSTYNRAPMVAEPARAAWTHSTPGLLHTNANAVRTNHDLGAAHPFNRPGLFMQNPPAPGVAPVVESLSRPNEPSPTAGTSRARAADAPPGYDFKSS